MKNRLTFIYIFLFAFIGCGPKPDIFFMKQISFRPSKTIAIMPFNNYSGQEDAGKQVSNAFLVELLKKPFFKVVDPGEVDRVMREERIRSSDQIDYATARKLKEQLSADYILIGSVNEYGLIKSGEREVPIIGFSMRMLDTESGQIVWAASHSRKGDDGELIFGWGTTRSLTKLTEKAVRQVVAGMKAQN